MACQGPNLHPRFYAAVEFAENSQVLAHLEAVLPEEVFSPFRDYDIEPQITYKRDSMSNGEEHRYLLKADVKNVGKQRITDFVMHVYFPRVFLNPHTGQLAEDRRYSTDSHICFFADRGRAPLGLYPGKGMDDPLRIDYFVNNELFRNAEAMRSQIVVELSSGSVPKTWKYNIKDYQEF